MPLVSFVVPSIGRDSLERALESLQKQTDPDWDAVVVCDGWERTYEGVPDDDRFHWIGTNCKSAGLARNFGLDYLDGRSDWMAFLDDDDVVRPEYVEHIRQHAQDYPWAEMIIFRMDHPILGILPKSNGQLAFARVGISFALHRDLASSYRFVREQVHRRFHEDWELVDRIVKDERRIFVSPHVDYIVRDYQ